MNDNTLYATVSLSIYQAYTAMETQRMKNQAYPIIQQFAELLLAAVSLNNGFLYDFISLSDHCGGNLSHSFLQRCYSSLRFAGICSCTGPTTAFYLGVGLDFLPFFFSHASRFAGVLRSCCMTQFIYTPSPMNNRQEYLN